MNSRLPDLSYLLKSNGTRRKTLFIELIPLESSIYYFLRLPLQREKVTWAPIEPSSFLKPDVATESLSLGANIRTMIFFS